MTNRRSTAFFPRLSSTLKTSAWARLVLLAFCAWQVIAPSWHVCDWDCPAPGAIAGASLHSHERHSHGAPSQRSDAASTRVFAPLTASLSADDCGACLACLLSSMARRDVASPALAPPFQAVALPRPRVFLFHENHVFRGEYSRGPPVA